MHFIVEAEVMPEKVLNDCKACASRALNQLGRDEPVGGDGHVMEARDGYGRTRTFARQSAMSSRSRASPWRSSWGTCPEAAHRSLTLAAQLRIAARTGRTSSTFMSRTLRHALACRSAGAGTMSWRFYLAPFAATQQIDRRSQLDQRIVGGLDAVHTGNRIEDDVLLL